ncbi:hypothetical protein ACFVGN_08845 [Streptomyces sp. NPDC057757]|uniref:hypothetical protein n=1 Tax=Streptomyces sp. NPDC057757 TaxID=3346241 RepID=UPI0036996CB9
MLSRFGISETVLAHLPHSLRLCHRHKVWIDSSHHYSIGHLPELITAQKKHHRLAHRLSGTLAVATAEASQLIRGWFITLAQPELQERWRSRLTQIPPTPRQPEYSNLVRRRVRDHEFIATYPEFVTMLGLIGDENWRSHRIPASQEVTAETHRNAIDTVFTEATRRLGVTTLRPSRGGRLFRPVSRASSFHNDALFRWVDPRGRVPTA